MGDQFAAATDRAGAAYGDSVGEADTPLLGVLAVDFTVELGGTTAARCSRQAGTEEAIKFAHGAFDVAHSPSRVSSQGGGLH